MFAASALRLIHGRARGARSFHSTLSFARRRVLLTNSIRPRGRFQFIYVPPAGARSARMQMKNAKGTFLRGTRGSNSRWRGGAVRGSAVYIYSRANVASLRLYVPIHSRKTKLRAELHWRAYTYLRESHNENRPSKQKLNLRRDNAALSAGRKHGRGCALLSALENSSSLSFAS